MHRSVLAVVLILLLGACAPGPGASSSPALSDAPDVPGTTAPVGGVPRCEDVPTITAPPEAYRPTPIYVGNEMPTEEIQAWAATEPGFEVLWIDRDHLGWVTVAFSQDAEARQAELAAEFPDVGVVAVGVDWTMAELDDLSVRASQALNGQFPVGTGTLVTQGVVEIGVGALTAERIAAVEQEFGGERVCVAGFDPALAPVDGPQLPGGEGWRLLASAEETGVPYRTGIATDAASYAALWAEAGLGGELPPVDFEAEVAIWFGAVYGSSCPGLRLDDVVVDHARSMVHATIVNPDPQQACTADAIPHAFVVALDRAKLPRGPFAIQLNREDPPAGVPEERTVVDVDLSAPGAVAEPGAVHGDPNLPEPDFVESGDIVETGFESTYRLVTHCGIEWLGQLNNVWWRTDVPVGSTDYVPPEWEVLDAGAGIAVVVLMTPGPEPTLTATANGHSVLYRPTLEAAPGCD